VNNEDKEIDYQSNKITIQSEDRWPEIKEWREFKKEKEKIKERYPSKPWIVKELGPGNHKQLPEEGWWEDWQRYKKEVTDLMLTEHGNFSKFLFEIRPEREDIGTRIWLRGKYNTEKYNRNKHKNK